MPLRTTARGAIGIATAALALRCASYGAGATGATPDAGAGAPPPDNPPPNGADAAADAPPGFCATAQLVDGGHALCADFDDPIDGLHMAWRGASHEVLLTNNGSAGLVTLIDAGRSPPNAAALSHPTTAGIDAAGGALVYTMPEASGVHVKFDIFLRTLPAPGATQATFIFEVRAGLASLDLDVRSSTTAVIYRSGPGQAVFDDLTPGFPPLEGNWRHVVLDVYGTGADGGVPRTLDVSIDGVHALAMSNATPPFPMFPNPVELAIGPISYSGAAPFELDIDNVTVDAR
jgi:hypothetical protein